MLLKEICPTCACQRAVERASFTRETPDDESTYRGLVRGRTSRENFWNRRLGTADLRYAVATPSPASDTESITEEAKRKYLPVSSLARRLQPTKVSQSTSSISWEILSSCAQPTSTIGDTVGFKFEAQSCGSTDQLVVYCLFGGNFNFITLILSVVAISRDCWH